ncbi:MAG: beta-ketoacyl synthase N-terminal-like domain-containing protein [Verrucomicrobiota bacterium]
MASSASSPESSGTTGPAAVLVTGGGAAGSLFVSLDALLDRLRQPGTAPAPDRGTASPSSADALAWAAAEAAWREADGPLLQAAGATVGVIVGSSRPVVETAATKGEARAVQDLVHTSPVAVAGQLARQLGCNGPCLTVSSACASGGGAIALAADLLAGGSCDAVLAGGVDLPTLPATAELFARNGLWTPDRAAAASRPFDPVSPGIRIADGAGFLLLEREGLRPPLPGAAVRLAGWAHRTDPRDRCGQNVAQTMLGACLSAALDRAGLDRGDLGFVYAHGNANPLSDSAERAALKRFFAATTGPVPVVASKHLTGHCLGTSSAIEAAVTARALKEGLALPACLQLGTSDASPPLPPKPPSHASVHALGLWGSCAALVFSRVSPAG